MTDAAGFIERLRQLGAPGEELAAVPMRDVFALAKAAIDMPLAEVELLLESPIHKARVGAVSVMDFQARRKATPESRRRELFELYLRRHDRIDSWDLVDRAAPHVVGGYLADRPRDALYELARSEVVLERRTAIVATYFFIRRGEVDDTFAIAELLVADRDDLIAKPVGGWIREAGKRDPQRLVDFLDRHAATMPRTALRYAIEKLDTPTRTHYLGLGRAG
jgi:3-methyladenine DNA glycosylase AlkD